MAIPTNTVRIIIFSLVVVAAILCIVSTATNVWVKTETSSAGIWKFCVKRYLLDSWTCQTIPSVDDISINVKTKAIQAFMIISCIGYGLVLVLYLLRIIKGVINAKIIAGVLVGIVLCEVIAMSLFVDQYRHSKNTKLKYGYSFGMGWVAAIITGIAAGLLLCFDLKESS